MQNLKAPIEGYYVPLFHLVARLKYEFSNTQKYSNTVSSEKAVLYLPFGEEPLSPLFHLRPKHLAPLPLVRICHLVSSVTNVVPYLRIKVI